MFKDWGPRKWHQYTETFLSSFVCCKCNCHHFLKSLLRWFSPELLATTLKKYIYIFINLLLFLPPHPHPFWFVRSPCNSLIPILRLAGSRSVYVCVCVEGWWGRGGGVVTTSTMGLAGPVLGFAWAEGGLLCLVGLPACLSKNYWSVTSYFNTPWWLCLYHKYVMGFSLASLLVYILIWGQKSDIISVQTHRLSDIIPSDCCQVLFCSLHIVCMCYNK